MARQSQSTTMNQSNANKLRTRIVELVQQEKRASFEIAEAIYELYYGTAEVGGAGDEMPLYEFFGFKSWFQYVETEVGMHVSTAQGYRMVHDVFMIRLKDKWDSSVNVSFTKLKALTKLRDKLDGRNVNSWLKRASEMTACALEDEIALELYGRRRGGAHRHFLAMLTDRQLTEMNTILAQAYDEFPDVDKRGDVLMKIVSQWSSAVMRKSKGNLRLVHGSKKRASA